MRKQYFDRFFGPEPPTRRSVYADHLRVLIDGVDVTDAPVGPMLLSIANVADAAADAARGLELYAAAVDGLPEEERRAQELTGPDEP